MKHWAWFDDGNQRYHKGFDSYADMQLHLTAWQRMHGDETAGEETDQEELDVLNS